MSDTTTATAKSRRAFFRTAGLGAGTVAASVVSIAGAAPAAAAEAPVESTGYRETAHVKRYYELAGY